MLTSLDGSLIIIFIFEEESLNHHFKGFPSNSSYEVKSFTNLFFCIHLQIFSCQKIAEGLTPFPVIRYFCV